MKTVLFPFRDTNVGGSYTSMANFASGIKESFAGKYNVVFVLPSIGRNHSLFLKTGCEVAILGIPGFATKLVNTTGVRAKRPLKFLAIVFLFLKSLVFSFSRRPDLVHVNDGISLVIWGVIGRMRKIPVIWEVRSERKNPKDARLIRFANFLLSDAWAIEKRFDGLGPIPPFFAIHNVVDTVQFSPALNAARLRSEFGITQETIAVGFVGNLVPRKRPEWAINAIIRILDLGYEVELFMIGCDYSQGGSYLAHLCDLISDRQEYRNRIHLLGYQKNVSEWMQVFDIFLLTSEKLGEAFPVVIVEAMATGLPIVSTDVAGVGEIVKHGENGFLSDPDDFEAFVDGVVNLLKNRERLIQFGKRSRGIASDGYSIQNGVSKLVDYYDSLLGL